MADEDEPHERWTVRELRQQILANAMHLFPTLVEEYLKKRKIIEAKPDQIFNIILVKVDGSYFDDDRCRFDTWAGCDCNDTQQAHLVYGGLENRKAVLTALPGLSRYECFVKLLDATERALAILDDGLCWPDEERMKEAIREGGYLIDLDLLMRSGHRATEDFRSGLTGGSD